VNPHLWKEHPTLSVIFLQSPPVFVFRCYDNTVHTHIYVLIKPCKGTTFSV
jgi:hypothetical protein